MQRDQKVGLALGVLLIGVVAAFFFRNEPEPGRNAPALENAAEIDREISEKRLTPYFSEIETEEPARGTPARTTASAQDRHDHRTGERKLPRWEDALKQADPDPFSGKRDGLDVPAPDPIQYEAAHHSAAPRPTTELNRVWKPSDESPEGSDSKLPDNAAPRFHEVQKGETLSSIAGKYLGSQARFQEIFAANRDQLQDANDLKVGMKLRIPDAAAKPSTGKNTSSQGARGKKAPEPQSVPAPPLEAKEDEPPSQDLEAITIGDSEVIPDEPLESKPASPVTDDPPKAKFTPSKRRPPKPTSSVP